MKKMKREKHEKRRVSVVWLLFCLFLFSCFLLTPVIREAPSASFRYIGSLQGEIRKEMFSKKLIGENKYHTLFSLFKT